MSKTSASHQLIAKYGRSWRQAWRQRKKFDTHQRLPHEIQFLPAALALQDQPAHPAPRFIILAIVLFSVLALIWACIGEIDVVATAAGKVVASGKSKTIQSSEVAVIRAINVHDGEQVKAGDVLIELDSSAASADVRRLKSDLMAAMVDSARAGAMLEAIRNHKLPDSLQGKIFTADLRQQHTAEIWLQGQYLELESALQQADAEIAQRSAEIVSANINVDSLQKSLPISRKLADDYKLLLAQQYVPRHAFLEKEQELLGGERELALQRSKVLELMAAKNEADERKQVIVAQARRAMLDLQQQSEQKVSSLSEEVKKAERRHSLMRLTAPVDGIVQQLAVHTLGG